MAKIDKIFKDLLTEIMAFGVDYDDPNREGVKRRQIPYYNFEYSMKEGNFPAITTKKLFFKGVVGELLWFLRGNSSMKFLVENNIHIWDKDGYKYWLKENILHPNPPDFDTWLKDLARYTNLGRIYGAQWRKWRTYELNSELYDENYSDIYEEGEWDQIAKLFKDLKEKPFSTEHIVTAWNPAEIDEMALPPCHFGFQVMCYPITPPKCDCSETEAIDCGSKCQQKIGFDLVWDQRSVDTFLGLPFNIASYALLMRIIEAITGYRAMNLRGSLRNVHLYDNAFDVAMKQIKTDPSKHGECQLLINSKIDETCLDSLNLVDFALINYTSYPSLGAEMLERD